MIEAMTEGGFKKRGAVFCPSDAISEDPVILAYARGLVERVQTLRALQRYSTGDFSFEVSMPHLHPVETFGLKFTINGTSVSLLSDTAYFKDLSSFYRTQILIICVVLAERRAAVQHLCLEDVERIIGEVSPKKAILTHFGMNMLKARPDAQAQILSHKLGVEVVAAYDGMKVDL
jgi:phosphoribosyl 1,2-cyclic phosphodiesterase